MTITKTLTRLITKVSVLVLLASLVAISSSGAFFNDEEVADGNTFATGSLDLTVNSPDGSFVATGMAKGDFVTRTINVGNDGTLPLQYRSEYAKTSGDDNLCQELQLTVKNGATNLYSGPLKDFVAPGPILNANLNPSSSDSLDFTITFVAANPASSDKTCEFDFNFIGWQTGIAESAGGFKDVETLTGNSIKVDDFVAPTVPVLQSPINDVTIKDDTPIFQWINSTDAQGIKGYYIRIYYGNENSNVWPDDNGHFVTVSEYDSLPEHHLEDGNYWWQVKAEDNYGNQSDWTAKAHFIVDTTGPMTMLLTKNSPIRTVDQDIINGDFDYGLTNWTTTGRVYVAQEEKIDTDLDGNPDVTISPHDILEKPNDNYNMVVIRPSEATNLDYPRVGNNFYYSMLQQPIPNSAKTISFWFNFATFDNFTYDDPGMAIFLNGKQIYQLWAKDINSNYDTFKLSGWRKFYYDISALPNPDPNNRVLSLVFFSGNKGDNQLDSWIYLDKVSTNDVVVNADTKIILKASDNLSGLTTHFKKGSCSGNATPEIYTFDATGFSLTGPTSGNKFCYWSEDQYGNKEGRWQVNMIYDNQAPPAITNLRVMNFGDGGYQLIWNVPQDTGSNITVYDIRYKDSKVTGEAGWSSMSSLEALIPIDAPLKPGAQQKLVIPSGTLNSTKDYWFAIKTQDAADNWSPISNIVNGISYNAGDVVINEVYYDVALEKGIEADNEWVELYNNTNEAINLKDWTLEDNSSSDVISDTDIDLPAHGFAVITEKATTWGKWDIPSGTLKIVLDSPIGNGLGNSGDRLILTDNSDQIIDEISWGNDSTILNPAIDTVVEGHSIARTTAGVDTNSAADWMDNASPNPGSNPHTTLETILDFTLANDKKSVGFSISGIQYWQKLNYRIVYNSDQGEQAIISVIDIPAGKNSLSKDSFKLGTCSTNGDVCTYNTGITNIKLTVTLTGSGVPDRTLEKEIVY